MQYACMCLQCMQRPSGKSGRQAFSSSVVKLDVSTRFEAVSCLLICNLLASTSEKSRIECRTTVLHVHETL